MRRRLLGAMMIVSSLTCIHCGRSSEKTSTSHLRVAVCGTGPSKEVSEELSEKPSEEVLARERRRLRSAERARAYFQIGLKNLGDVALHAVDVELEVKARTGEAKKIPGLIGKWQPGEVESFYVGREWEMISATLGVDGVTSHFSIYELPGRRLSDCVELPLDR